MSSNHKLIDKKQYCEFRLEKYLSIDEQSEFSHYDKFFSLYVCYNIIYQSIHSKCKYEISRYRELEKNSNYKLNKEKKGDTITIPPHDTFCATYLISCYTFRKLDGDIFNDEHIKSDIILGFSNLFENFWFQSDGDGNGDTQYDMETYMGIIGSENEEQKLYCLLRAIYNIRCNLFHGEKNVTVDQSIVLEKANDILYIVIKYLLSNLYS